ncbi:hypothetical protein [Sphingomonas sp. YL-JM2C]
MFHSAMLEAPSADAAIEALHRAGHTDGLPVVLPTAERVEAMLLHGGLDGDLVIGTVDPAGGALTVEKAAINAVMAGCPPEAFPILLAACAALVDPRLDLGAMQATTHCITPLIIVNGPARSLHGVACEAGAMGPGHRVNAGVGRAIRLIMINIGGGRPGVGDMATLGTPAKFACCLGEAEEASPFPPLHVALGHAGRDSVVTMLGVEGPHSLMFAVQDAGRDGDAFLRTLAAGLANPASNNIYLGGTVAVALNPMHANMLARSGFTRETAQQRLFELAAVPRDQLHRIAAANVALAPPDTELFRPVRRPEDILLFTSGADGGAYSAYFPSWGGGPNGNVAVTKTVRIDEGCELPASRR